MGSLASGSAFLADPSMWGGGSTSVLPDFKGPSSPLRAGKKKHACRCYFVSSSLFSFPEEEIEPPAARVLKLGWAGRPPLPVTSLSLALGRNLRDQQDTLSWSFLPLLPGHVVRS